MTNAAAAAIKNRVDRQDMANFPMVHLFQNVIVSRAGQAGQLGKSGGAAGAVRNDENIVEH